MIPLKIDPVSLS